MRQETVEQIRVRLVSPPGVLRVLMHSLAFGALKPLAGAEQLVSRKQLEITADTMGHSLVYWVQDCLRAGVFDGAGGGRRGECRGLPPDVQRNHLRPPHPPAPRAIENLAPKLGAIALSQ